MLGTNTAHFDIEALRNHGLDCAEVCLGREKPLKANQIKIYTDLERANQLGLPISVHLPIEMPKRFTRDYLDAMFLEADDQQREIAFEMLTLNFEKLSSYQIQYYVVHFPGVITNKEDSQVFLKRLRGVLERMDTIAKTYNVTLLLEYFGSNVNFYEPQQWIDEIEPFSNLGILVDTGHLYFASIIWSFDFMRVLSQFSKVAKAYHIWTTMGSQVYGQSEVYQKYKHIVPHLNQKKAEGWAFDTKEVLDLIMRRDKPIIIEAAPLFMGEKYYKDGIKSMVDYFQNC